jgi:hypothetical protein
VALLTATTFEVQIAAMLSEGRVEEALHLAETTYGSTDDADEAEGNAKVEHFGRP